MKVTLGGDRLGSGNKQEINARTFNRSTHDLNYAWRSTIASGVLTPFLSIPALRGDSFDIDLNCDIKTLPTSGPLFGSFKVQLDIFQCPIRLYQGQLHMNKLGIGMKMHTVKLPQIKMEANTPLNDVIDDNLQINPSCIFSYLNIRGLGKSGGTPGTVVTRYFNAVPYLSYWDIYKNYYANKQEEIGAMIHNPMNTAGSTIPTAALYTYGAQNPQDVFDTPVPVTFEEGQGVLEVIFPATLSATPNHAEIIMTFDGTQHKAIEYFGYYEWIDSTNTMRFWEVNQGYSGSHTIMIPTQSVPYLPPTLVNPLITTFPLENIDEMREDILMAVKNTDAFEITKDSNAPYGLPLGIGDTANAYCKTANLEGLALKTYQSDLFNNWVSTEWIDGVDGISAVTSVDTSSGSFTIDQLNIASKVYSMLNRIAVSGGTYNDWLNAVYEDNRTRAIETPMYIGGLSKELAFQEVISNASATNKGEEQPLGELAGRGIMTNKHKGGSIKIRIDEPSYIIGLISLTPRIDYSQGNNWDVNLKTMDDFHKPSLDAIGFQDLITDQMHWADTTIATDGTISFKSAGKQPAWINYMTNVNQIRGNFAKETDSMFMVLNRRYEANLQGIKDLTTYIDPSKFNHIFADARTDAQNFWAQIGIGITSRRLMSAKLIPNL